MPSSLAAAVAASTATTKTTGTTNESSKSQHGETISNAAAAAASSYSSSSLLLSPYLMCSRQECQDREKWGQVSVWEATTETRHFGNAKHRRMDPTRAVKKYRRSAAGSSHQLNDEGSAPVRSLSQLCATVNNLVHLLATMGEFKDDDCNDNDENGSVSTSFVDLVNFVEDRIRAVQVDLVLLQSPSMTTLHADNDTGIKKQIQYRLIKVHILILYLLSDVSSSSATTTITTTQVRYSHKFGHQALATALSNYWGCDIDHDIAGQQDQQQQQQRLYDDEVLSYMAMYELHKDLDQKDCAMTGDCCLASNILELYRKHVGTASKRRRRSTGSSSSRTSLQQTYPLFQWAMQVIVACNLGHWHVALQMLYEKGRQHEPPAHDGNAVFGSLIRCTLAMMPGCGGSTTSRSSSPASFFAGALFKLRHQALRAYNLSFRKEEAVCGQDIARLLVCKIQNNRNSFHAATSWGDNDDHDDDGNDEDKRPLNSRIGENDNNNNNNDIWLDAKRAIRIGQAVNLPVNEHQTALIFKVAPITTPMDSSFMQHNNVARGSKETYNIRDDDAFVLLHVESAFRHCHHSISLPLAVPSKSWIRQMLE